MFYPNFYYEKLVWKKEVRIVGGIDEVGRGAIAGPVVAGCVVFKKGISSKLEKSYSVSSESKTKVRIDDSKRLTKKQRNIADAWIKENCLTWGLGEASAKDIDKSGIVKATGKAMRKAIAGANQRFHKRIDFILIDAYYIPYVRGIRMPIKSQRKLKTETISGGNQKAIIKGDQRSFSIASASIIAKVYRDGLMLKIGTEKKYKKYGWDKNKGYGTTLHKKMIQKYKWSDQHRKSFILK